MKIIPLKYYDGGYVTQAFAFGGSRDKAACDPNITYPSSLQNFLIDDGNHLQRGECINMRCLWIALFSIQPA